MTLDSYMPIIFLLAALHLPTYLSAQPQPIKTSVNQSATQADPTSLNSATFTVVFGSPIDPSTFTASDMAVTGTAGTVTQDPRELAPFDSTVFDVTVTGMNDGDTVVVALPAGRVQDVHGNANDASVYSDNRVTYDASDASCHCQAISLGNSPAFSSNKSYFVAGGTPRTPEVICTPEITRDATLPVGNPVTHGMNLYVPVQEYPGQTRLKCGFLDVTQPPFNADPTGNTASADANTKAFTEALKAGREYMLAVYVPQGEYVVGDRIACAQGYTDFNLAKTGVTEDRQGACLLIGARTSAHRPTIVLKDNAFTDPSHPRPVVIFWARQHLPRDNPKPNETQPGVSFNNKVIGIDFDLGAGNDGAVALDLDGAQGTAIEDVKVTAKGSFYAGFTAIPGAGAGMHHVEVDGGQYGIHTFPAGGASSGNPDFVDNRSTGVMPTVSGSTFRNQSKGAIVYKDLGTLGIVGTSIRSLPGTTAISGIGAGVDGLPGTGMINMVDTRIEFTEADPNNVALQTNRSTYLKNVYVAKAATLAAAGFSFTNDCKGRSSLPGNVETLSGNAHGWLHVQEYAASIDVHSMNYSGGCTHYANPSYLNGRARPVPSHYLAGTDSLAPPGDLQSRHQWDSTFPNWEGAGVVNVKLAPYNAVGDGYADDTQAIQGAIDDNPGKTVFLPKGYYRVKSTITMKPDTKIVGVSGHLSQVLGYDDGLAGGTFGDDPAGGGSPVLESANDANGTAVLAFIGIFQPPEERGAYPLHWQTGHQAILRDISIVSRSLDNNSQDQERWQRPQVLINNNGGGRWYDYFRDAVWLWNWNSDSPNFRFVKIEGTVQPLTFYQFNAEGQKEQQWIKAGISNAQHVTIFNYKDEGPQLAMRIKDSKDINIYGYGGISHGDDNHANPTLALFDISNSTDFTLSSLVIRGHRDADPGAWSMIKESALPGGGSDVATTPTDMPVLYKRTDNSVTGLGETPEEPGFEVSVGPNPLRDGHRPFGVKAGQDAEVQVVTLLGQPTGAAVPVKKNIWHQLDTGSLRNGVYLLLARNAIGQVIVKQFVVQR